MKSLSHKTLLPKFYKINVMRPTAVVKIDNYALILI